MAKATLTYKQCALRSGRVEDQCGAVKKTKRHEGGGIMHEEGIIKAYHANKRWHRSYMQK